MKSRLPAGYQVSTYNSSCRLLVLGVLFVWFLTTDVRAQVTAADLADYRNWGMQVADDIEAELLRNGSVLYSERTNFNGDDLGGINGYAFVWPASVQFRTLNSMLQADFIRPRVQSLLEVSDELHLRYWDLSADGENGYVVAPGSLERYYDDNAHLVVALTEAHELTGVQRLLDRAIATHDFVLEGEDSHQDGGIYFREGSFGNKNTISTLQAARGAAMIHQANGQQRFLDDAIRLLEWSNSHVQRDDGLYYQEFREVNIGDISNVPLTNGAGMGILTNLELYDITQDPAYLQEAQRVGARAVDNFTANDNGRIFSAGYWAFEFVDALVDLYHHDLDPRWLNEAAEAVEFLKTDLEDNNGHYGLDWNFVNANDLARGWPNMTEWDLINQASVARSYLYTGLAPAPTLPGDFNLDELVNLQDWSILLANFDEDLTALPYFDRRLQGDLDVNGVVDHHDFRRFKSLYIDAHGEAAFAALLRIPEPGALALAIAGSWLATVSRIGRR